VVSDQLSVSVRKVPEIANIGCESRIHESDHRPPITYHTTTNHEPRDTTPGLHLLLLYNQSYMIRFSTAGESHGEALIALISGLPAGVPIDLDFVNRELWRRQQGYGRGGRMKIETDKAHVLSGVRHGKTIGTPVAIEIVNRDWKNWEEKLPVEAGDPAKHQAVASPRPGHADLAGALKYNFPDARYVLERASARESTSRVAAGAMAKLMLRELGIDVLSHVIRVGRAEMAREAQWDEIVAIAAKDDVMLACVDPEAEARMKEEVEHASRTGDTVNGVFEVVAHNVPAGLGTYANWDERLDGLLAWSVMSLQAVKAVEIGRGVTAAESFGSQVHDPIAYADHDTGKPTRFTRPHNNAGGIEGGISNGEDLVVRGYLKPISTLRRPLESVRFDTREKTAASYERSDICVVPAAGVAAEAMVAITLAGLAQQKFGGDSLVEMKRNFQGYIEQIRKF
jgi:chorismate synthase